MRVSRRELALWSFLMSTAHGAGLMVAPVLIGLDGSVGSEHASAHEAAGLGLADGALGTGAVGVVLRVLAMLAVMGVVAVVVYDRLGLRVLRTAWRRLWAAAFVIARGDHARQLAVGSKREPSLRTAACAAATRATGTRYGLHET